MEGMDEERGELLGLTAESSEPEGVSVASSVTSGRRPRSPTASESSYPPFMASSPRPPLSSTESPPRAPIAQQFTPPRPTSGNSGAVFKRDSSFTQGGSPPGSTRSTRSGSPRTPGSSGRSRGSTPPQRGNATGASSKASPKQEPLCLQWPTREEYACCGQVRVKRVGMLYVLAEWEKADGGKRRLYLGPYWHFLLMTVSLLVCIACFVYVKVVPTSWTSVRIVGIFLTVLSFVSLAATSLSDPGIFPRYFKRIEPNWTYSEYAHSFRPPGTIFCQETQILIEEYNHFCPWSGTAIGKGNEPFFQVFLSSLVASLVYDIVIISLALHYKKL